ncbi:MAG: helix-turn-helix transcriptional regulator [Candidatus Omnitrophica bacterium]|nr:helix-turn-helix transcriptional regulator [Candidatus Omnitrophota bacterium]
MKNSSLKKADHLLNEKLMAPHFRRGFQAEYAKVLLTQKIAEIRKKSRIDQKTLAQRLGVSQQVVSRIETGENSNLTIDTLTQLARALGHTVRISFHKSTAKDIALEVGG